MANSKMSATGDSVRDWFPNVPHYIASKQMPYYFRFIWERLKTIVLEVTPIAKDKQKHAANSIQIVDSLSKVDKFGKRKGVKITAPPGCIKFPALHRLGNFPSVGKSASGADFTLEFYEGDIDAATAKSIGWTRKGLEAEQKAYFDFLQEYFTYLAELAWENPLIRPGLKDKLVMDRIKKNAKGTTKEQKAAYLTKNFDKLKEKLMQDEAAVIEMKEEFISAMNVNNEHKESPFVRNQDGTHEYYGTSRFIVAKKAVGVAKKANDRAPPADAPDYIKELFNDPKEPLVYSPPYIMDPTGMGVDLGYNEEQYLFAGSIGIPNIYARMSDSAAGLYITATLADFQWLKRETKNKFGAKKGLDLSASLIQRPMDSDEEEEDEGPSNSNDELTIDQQLSTLDYKTRKMVEADPELMRLIEANGLKATLSAIKIAVAEEAAAMKVKGVKNPMQVLKQQAEDAKNHNAKLRAKIAADKLKSSPGALIVDDDEGIYITQKDKPKVVEMSDSEDEKPPMKISPKLKGNAKVKAAIAEQQDDVATATAEREEKKVDKKRSSPDKTLTYDQDDFMDKDPEPFVSPKPTKAAKEVPKAPKKTAKKESKPPAKKPKMVYVEPPASDEEKPDDEVVDE